MRNSRVSVPRARNRWNMLTRAVKETEIVVTNPLDQHPYLSLFEIEALPPDQENNETTWYQYSIKLQQVTKLEVRLPTRQLTVKDLSGFNNTGNIRIWPAEEVLAYLILKHDVFFRSKHVLEVGGGMSCLAGMCLARQIDCLSVVVTDGNEMAVNNVREIIDKNTFRCPVSCDVFVWSEYYKRTSTYDVIMGADCLYFEDSRTDLVRLITALLEPNGVALFVAPARCGSVRKFVAECRNSQMKCSVCHYYDEGIRCQYELLKGSTDFDADAHYPLLIVVQKTITTEETMWNKFNAIELT